MFRVQTRSTTVRNTCDLLVDSRFVCGEPCAKTVNDNEKLTSALTEMLKMTSAWWIQVNFLGTYRGAMKKRTSEMDFS